MNAPHPITSYYGTPPGAQYDAMRQLDVATLDRNMQLGALRRAEEEVAERAQECLQAGVPLPTVVRLLDDMSVRAVEMAGLLGVPREMIYQAIDSLRAQE